MTAVKGGAKDPDAMPTIRQATVLMTLEPGRTETAAQIGVRQDVMWRMEQCGWVARTHDKWHILADGVTALGRWREKEA